MKYKALVSFSGQVSMAMGEVRELTDKTVVKDLLNAGYIMEMKADKITRPRRKKGEKA